MASTRWRLNFSAGNGPTYLGIATLQMAATAGGPDLCTGGTASASTVDSAPYAAAMAFDGNAATYWSTSIAGGLVGWLEYLFPSPVTVAEYSVQSIHIGGAYAPQAWTLESWDGAVWVVADTRTNQVAWGVGQTRTYTVTASSGGGGSTTASQLILLGIPTQIAQNIIYALPARASLITTSAPCEIGQTLTGPWTPTTNLFVAGSFIRCTTGSALVTCKARKV